jgi:hypothetical protein
LETLPRVKHAESCGDHKEIIKEEIVVHILTKSQQKAYHTNEVPEGSVGDHAWVETPFLIVKR